MTQANSGYRQPPFPAGNSDSEFSASGRFGRLSYLAWMFLLTLVFYVLALVVGIAFGVSAAAIGQAESGLFGGISMTAILGFVVLYIAFLYFLFVFAIRRLHDLNQTGWLSLLFLVPLLNIIFGLYILFAKGTPGPNNYGPQRITLGWEKVLGWIYIVITVLSLAAVAIFGGAIMSSLSQSQGSLDYEGGYSGEAAEQKLDEDMARLKAQLEQLEKNQSSQ